MSNKVVLLDLENNTPSIQLFRDLIEHYSTLYIFNGLGQFEFSLADLTEFASWLSSGQVIVLDTLAAKEKEFEYAVVVGQMLALIELETHVDVISAMPSSPMLVEMITASGFTGHLIQVGTESKKSKQKHALPPLEVIQSNPQLSQVKKYCDAIFKHPGKPNHIDTLKNSLSNILHIDLEQSQQLLGMLISLKIVKKQDDQISFRKKILKQWASLDLTQEQTEDSSSHSTLVKVDSILSKLKIDPNQLINDINQLQSLQNAQSDLFKNFEKIDPVQMEVIRKLNEMKSEKPKDIYALRDLLEKLFPQSDVRLLLKEMIDKGYIYWNGHAVIYSHEMFLN